MNKITLFFLIFISLMKSNYLFAYDEENYIYKSVILRFHKTVEVYNKDKSLLHPEIVFDRGETYALEYKNLKVHFTLLDVLSDRFYANNKRFSWTKVLKIKPNKNDAKTTFFEMVKRLIPMAMAGVEDSELGDFSSLNIDSSTTKIMMNALGDFTKSLESISTISFDPCISNSCITQRRARNIDRLYQTANYKLDECNAAKEMQLEGIEKAKSYQQAEWLTSFNDYEFRAVKSFFDRIAKKNLKDSVSFLESATNFKDKSYTNCMGVLLSGTLGDSMASNFGMGVSAMGAIGATSLVKVELINNAGKVCAKFQDLRDCLKEVKDNVVRINNLKRSIKKSDGTSMPMDAVPSNSITK